MLFPQVSYNSGRNQIWMIKGTGTCTQTGQSIWGKCLGTNQKKSFFSIPFCWSSSDIQLLYTCSLSVENRKLEIGNHDLYSHSLRSSSVIKYVYRPYLSGKSDWNRGWIIKEPLSVKTTKGKISIPCMFLTPFEINGRWSYKHDERFRGLVLQ